MFIFGIRRLTFSAKPYSLLTPSLYSELKVYIYSGRQFGEALRGQSGLPDLLRHTFPMGVTSQAIPRQTRGLEECSVSGQLLQRHSAAKIPRGRGLGRMGPPGLLQPAAARSHRRRAGVGEPSTPHQHLWGGGSALGAAGTSGCVV